MILPLSLLILLATVALVPLMTRVLGRNAGWPIAAVDLALAISFVLYSRDIIDGGALTFNIPWIPRWGTNAAFRLDGLSWFFLMLALVIGSVVMVYSTRYFDARNKHGERLRHNSYYLLMATFTLSMVLLVITDDLILLFVAWELTSLMSFMLIGRSGHAGEAGALRTLFLTYSGGLFFLAAMVVTITATGTTSLTGALSSPVWVNRPGLTSIVAVLVAISCFTKAAQFPFHLWLPEAMAAETPISAYLHAAAVVKAGIYVLLRFSAIFRMNLVWQILLVVIGMFTAIMGALFALQKTDLKKLLAYSTVSQLGWIVATIGIGTHAALTAAMLHTFAHALFKSGLFMSIGCVQHATGTRDIRRLPALRKHMPFLFVVVIVGAAGMAGIPPTLGFISKEAMLHTFLHAWPDAHPAPAIFLTTAGVIGAILTVAYCFRIIFGGFIDGERTVITPAEAARKAKERAAHEDLRATTAALNATAAGTTGRAKARALARAQARALARAQGKSSSTDADHQPGPDYELVLHRVSPIMIIPAAIPALLGIPLYFLAPQLGHLFSGLSVNAINPATVSYLYTVVHHGKQLTDTHLHLIEFSPVLLLSLLAIFIGALLTWQRERVNILLDRELLPRTGAENLISIWKAMRAFGNRVGRVTRSDSPTRHAGALVVCLSVMAAGVLIAWATGNLRMDPRAEHLDRPIDLVVLGIVLISVLGVVVLRSRMGAVVLLGTAGAGVTLQIFALGAPDVGLTQLLVEILTTVMYMLVLRRLPRRFSTPSKRRHRWALAIAIPSGLAAFGGVLAFTGRRGRSELAEYFLERGPGITTGTNVTNTIINEFRAIDTYGEMAVLGCTAIAIATVLLSVQEEYRHTGTPAYTNLHRELQKHLRKLGRTPLPTSFAYRDPIANSYPLRMFTRVLTPIIIVMAAILAWRGHNAPGGGFIAGLLIASLIALWWLAAPNDRPVTRRIVPGLMVVTGLGLATLTGFVGYASSHDHSEGYGVDSHTFLSALHWDLPVIGHVPSAFFFDMGVLLSVLGMVVAALNMLGSSQEPYGSTAPEIWPPFDPLHPTERWEGPATDPEAHKPGYDNTQDPFDLHWRRSHFRVESLPSTPYQPPITQGDAQSTANRHAELAEQSSGYSKGSARSKGSVHPNNSAQKGEHA